MGKLVISIRHIYDS